MYSPANHSTRAGRFVISAGLLLTVLLAGCGDDDPVETAAPDPVAPITEDVVEVSMIDYAFVGLPETVPVGTRLAVSNDAPAELHELVAFRIPDGEERSVSDLLMMPPLDLMGVLSEPVSVLLAAPGGEMIPAVGDGSLDEPGRYLIMCAIPTGADPGEYLAAAATSDGPPDVEGGPPHLAHGMWAELMVE